MTTGAELSKQIDDLRVQLTTCTGDECKLLDSAIKALEAQKLQMETLPATVAAEVRKALDSGLAVTDGRLKGLEDRFTKHVPETAYFICDKCGTPWEMDKDVCPNPECASDIDWEDTLNGVIDDARTRRAKK